MKSFVLNQTRSILLGGLMLFITSIGWAQQTSGDISLNTSTAVRVIDNKGTIKYLQSSNGITTLTNSTADVTTTTWQLGGTLTTDTYIDVDGNVFALDGIDLTTASASTNAVSGDDAQGGGATGTGYTLLVRNEATGAIEKLLASGLILSGSSSYTAVAIDETTDPTITVTGISTTAAQVWVYRNGAKLVTGTDYTVATNSVTLVSTNYPIYTGDFFEIQWVK